LNARSGLAAQNVEANVQAANSASRATVTVVRLDGTLRGSTPKATPTMIEIQSAMPTVVRAVRPYPPSAKARANTAPPTGSATERPERRGEDSGAAAPRRDPGSEPCARPLDTGGTVPAGCFCASLKPLNDVCSRR